MPDDNDYTWFLVLLGLARWKRKLHADTLPDLKPPTESIPDGRYSGTDAKAADRVTIVPESSFRSMVLARVQLQREPYDHIQDEDPIIDVEWSEDE